MILAIDTCLAACQATVGQGGRTLASRSEPMARGHQERLAPIVREVMEEAGISFAALERVAVTVGPGSFTGLRVGIAFAKGLSFALGAPCVGLGTLDALAAGAGEGAPVAAAIDAGRGNLYMQLFEAGRPLTAPDVLPLGVASARLAEVLGERPFRLSGPAAEQLAEGWSVAEVVEQAWPRCDVLLALGTAAPLTPARPLYLRPPDATPKAVRETTA